MVVETTVSIMDVAVSNHAGLAMCPWMACTSRPLRIGLYQHNHSSNAVVGVGEHLANCNLCGQVAVSVRYQALGYLDTSLH